MAVNSLYRYRVTSCQFQTVGFHSTIAARLFESSKVSSHCVRRHFHLSTSKNCAGKCHKSKMNGAEPSIPHSISSPSTRTDSLLLAIKSRRSHYSLSKKLPVSEGRILDIVATIAKHTPSSHNSQSTRLVVLLNEEHVRLWDMTIDVLRAMVPADIFKAATEPKLRGLREGSGTVLFFEDASVVQKLQEDYPSYKQNFPTWSEHSNAMHQILLWTALEFEGLGCNLQHYNPLIDEKVRGAWGVESNWTLKAQMVFGGLAGKAKEKSFQPMEKKLFVYGQKASREKS